MKLIINPKLILLIILILYVNTNLLKSKFEKNDPKYTALRKWSEEGGSIFGKFKIKYLKGDNRFVVASDLVKAKDNISTVPDKLILSEANPLIKPTCDKYTLEDQKCIATFVCLEMKNPNNFFKAFLDFLPFDYATYPIFFNKKIRSLLKGSVLMDEEKEWRKSLTEEYEYLKIKGDINFTQKEYDQCRHVVFSRNFSVIHNKKSISAIVPISDLFNFHPLKVNVYWFYDENSKSFKIEATKEIKKGEEIFVPYGNHDNIYYLFFYGFTIPNNPTLLQYKYYFKNTKIVLANPVEIEHQFNVYRTNSSEMIVSLEDEVHALITMKEHLFKYLTAFKTNLQQDSEQIKKPEVQKDFSLMNVYTVLIEEKKLLTNYINIIDGCIKALKSPKDQAKIMLEKMMKTNLSIKYLTALLSFLQ